MLTSVLPSMPALHGALFQTGTDSQNWFVSDIELVGNPAVTPFKLAHENYGFDRMIVVLNGSRSLPSMPPTRFGELPFHRIHSTSEAQVSRTQHTTRS